MASVHVGAYFTAAAFDSETIVAPSSGCQLSLASATIGSGVLADGVICQLGPLAARASAQVTISLRAVAAGSQLFVAQAVPNGRETELDPADNVDVENLLVIVPLSISCSADVGASTDPGLGTASVGVGTATAVGGAEPVTVAGVRSDGLRLDAPYSIGVTTIHWTAEDASGQSASCTQTVTVADVDDDAPVTDATAPTGWSTTAPVSVALSAGDAASGVRQIRYTVAGVETVVSGGAATVSIDADGVTEVTFHAVDNAGNAETPQTVTVRIDTVAPSLACDSPDAAWHADNVGITCTATDAGSGLAAAGDASFELSTSVGAGQVDANAETGSWQLCDVAGNCATAGPIAGNKIDRRAPTLTLPADRTVDATSPEGAVVSFAVSASDGADPNPGVSCSPVSGSVFAIGTSPVACTARDHVGNEATGSFTVTVLGAKAQLARLIQKVVAASALPAVVKAQLLARVRPLLAGFDPSKPAQRRAVCSGLNEFAAVLRLVSGHGVPPAQATSWIADARRIRAVIGC